MNCSLRKISASLKWWHVGLLSVAVSFLGKLAGGTSSDTEVKIYTKKLKQAPWAPPAWLFGPAWTINNFFLLLGLQQLINESEGEDRKRLLALQGGIWAIFFSFNYIYFNKKSPVLAALWTMSDAVLATISLAIAAKADKKLAAKYLPLTAWALFASTLADYQALKNDDPVLKTKALLD